MQPVRSSNGQTKKRVFLTAIAVGICAGQLNAQTDNKNLTAAPDTIQVDGYLSLTGLIQKGNENRTLIILLSDFVVNIKKFLAEPLTSIAYSAKPGKQLEGEYFENLTVRYRQDKTFYPAAGISFENSFLRKIKYRWGGAALIVCNVVKTDNHKLKIGIGYNHEFTRFDNDNFVSPPFLKDNGFKRTSDQLYCRVKGKNRLFKGRLLVSYDMFYQPSFKDFSDYRWTVIGNIDVPLSKNIDFKTSIVSSYETFVAPDVANANFRLSYGVNIKFSKYQKSNKN